MATVMDSARVTLGLGICYLVINHTFEKSDNLSVI